MEVAKLEVKSERIKKHKPEAFKIGVRDITRSKIMKLAVVGMVSATVANGLLAVALLGQPITGVPMMFFGITCIAGCAAASFTWADRMFIKELPKDCSKDFQKDYKHYKELQDRRSLGTTLAALTIVGIFAGVALKTFAVGSKEVQKTIEQNKKIQMENKMGIVK